MSIVVTSNGLTVTATIDISVIPSYFPYGPNKGIWINWGDNTASSQPYLWGDYGMDMIGAPVPYPPGSRGSSMHGTWPGGTTPQELNLFYNEAMSVNGNTATATHTYESPGDYQIFATQLDKGEQDGGDDSLYDYGHYSFLLPASENSVTGAASGAQVHFTGRRALTTYSSGTNAAKIFEPTNNCNLVGLGDYPNTSSISNAVNGTLDAIAIDAGVRLIIYSGANYGGSVVLDAVGPKVIYNDYNMKYNEEDDDGEEGHANYLGMMLDEPHESNWSAIGAGSLPLMNQLSELMTGWDTSVMDPSGSGQTLSARFPSPTGNVNSIDGARIRSYEIGYAPSDVNATMRPGANMHNWVGSFKIRSASTAPTGATYRVNVTARNVDHWSWSLDGGPDNMMPAGSTFADITIGEASSSTTIQNMSWMDRAAMSPADGYFYNYNDRHWGPAFPISSPPSSNSQWVNTYYGPETKIAFFEDKLTAIYLNDTGETSVDYATLQAYWNSVTSLKVVWAYFPGFSDVVPSAEPNNLRGVAANYTGIKIGGVDTGITGATLFDGGWQYSHNTLPGATSGTPGYSTTPWTSAWGTSYTGLPSELRLFYSNNQEFDIPIPTGNTTWLRNATSSGSGWGTNNFSAMAYYNLDLEYPILGTSFGGDEETEYYFVAGIIPVLVGYTRS